VRSIGDVRTPGTKPARLRIAMEETGDRNIGVEGTKGSAAPEDVMVEGRRGASAKPSDCCGAVPPKRSHKSVT